MLEGIESPCYSSSANEAKRLETIGATVPVTAGVVPLTVGVAGLYGYLVYLRCDCVVAGTTAGFWALDNGAVTVLVLQQPVAGAIVGSSYCWPFPIPWKTAAKAGLFSLTPNVGTMGTWNFIVNGFMSSL